MEKSTYAKPRFCLGFLVDFGRFKRRIVFGVICFAKLSPSASASASFCASVAISVVVCTEFAPVAGVAGSFVAVPSVRKEIMSSRVVVKERFPTHLP